MAEQEHRPEPDEGKQFQQGIPKEGDVHRGLPLTQPEAYRRYLKRLIAKVPASYPGQPRKEEAASQEQPQTPTEQLLASVEKPLENVESARNLNNNAVELFALGEMTTEQLVGFSIGLARGAENLAGQILSRDNSKNPMPETKRMSYSSMLSLAQENRERIINLTLAQQKNTP